MLPRTVLRYRQHVTLSDKSRVTACVIVSRQKARCSNGGNYSKQRCRTRNVSSFHNDVVSLQLLSGRQVLLFRLLSSSIFRIFRA